MKRDGGFSLTELVVSTGIIVLTLFVVFGMFPMQRKAAVHVDYRLWATTTAYNLLEQVRGGTPPATSGTVDGMSYEMVTSAAGHNLSDVAVTVRFSDATGVRQVTVETLIGE